MLLVPRCFLVSIPKSDRTPFSPVNVSYRIAGHAINNISWLSPAFASGYESLTKTCCAQNVAARDWNPNFMSIRNAEFHCRKRHKTQPEQILNRHIKLGNFFFEEFFQFA